MYGVVLFGAIRSKLAAHANVGVLLVVALAAVLAFHIAVDIGMSVGLPVTGIPLPFMSYGGTAILTDFAAIGLLLNVYLQRERLVF